MQFLHTVDRISGNCFLQKWHGDWQFILPAQESVQGELPWPSKRSSHAALCIPSSAGPVVLIVGGLGICQVPCPDDAYFWDVTTSRWYRVRHLINTVTAFIDVAMADSRAWSAFACVESRTWYLHVTGERPSQHCLLWWIEP